MRKFVKPSILLLTAIFIVVDIFGTLVFVQPAKAQFGGPTTIVADVPRTVSEVKKGVKLGVKEVLTMSAMGALMNGLTYFTRKLAYDTAQYVASGGSGQGALVFKQGVGEYIGNAGLDAVGEIIGTIGEPFGISLCQASGQGAGTSSNLNVNLAVSLRNLYSGGQSSGAGTGPKPRCGWQELKDSWGNLDEQLGKGASAFTGEIFTNSLNIGESDFGISLGAISAVESANYAAQTKAQLERVIGQGFKDVVSPISGRTRTPASQVKKELEGLSATEQQKLTAGQIAGIYGSSLQSLPYMAANVFLNTLTSELLKNVMTGLFDDEPDSGSGFASGVGSYFASTLQDNRKSAQRALNFLISANVAQLDNYNVVADFVARQVIDNGFQQAIDGGNNRALTISQAVESNYLHSNWLLIPPTHAWNSSVDNDCYVKAYCYSNMQKLRKARILPLGFELAALKSDPDAPWSLGDVVNGFNDCNQFGEADKNHPYCHLIDPNWVIKSPQTRCQAEVIGPELIEKTIPTRKAECVDLQTCVSEENDGTCNAWGYCTKEENVWRLGGEECPDYFSTCTTYNNTANGASNSFLSRTLDFGECTAESVGCSAYSSEKVNDEWVTTTTTDTGFKIAGRNQTLYFNNEIEACPASSEGCSVFYGAQRNPATGLFTQNNDKYIRNSADIINLKKAPEYLHCYDIDPSTEYEIDWPQTVSQVLNDLPNNFECGNFAGACAPTEVGCSEFTSTNTGNSLSAIVNIENSCSSECVGYETFKQEESNFEGEKFPLYFVPELGQSCLAQATGCDEFTNLETSVEGENLEYYNYLRSCLKPEETNEKIFLSWEGSHNEGYVLRNHRLATIDEDVAVYINGLTLTYTGAPIETAAVVFPEGSPAYTDNTKAQLQKNYDSCNETAYNILMNNLFDPDAAHPDCRQFYDNEGNIYYRLLADTVIVSEQCRELRKTESNLFVDADITDQSACEGVADGFWDGASCNRCYGGGQYEGGTCFYRSLKEESSQCSVVFSGCRVYTGNTGNNLRPDVILDGFEGDPSGALSVWSSGSISAEALQSTQHSLRVAGGIIERTIAKGTIDADNSLYSGAWYELSFWARGIPQNLGITFEQTGIQVGLFTADAADPTIPSTITIGNSWREYSLGPVQFDGESEEDLVLKFDSLGGSSDYYIDNVRLSQLEDSVYLLKNSWKQIATIDGENVVIDAPLACFGGSVNPEGALPGSALGCSEYTDERDNTYYITGFSSLCREAAIGCEPVYDSNNTPGDILPRVYNTICNGTSGLCEISLLGEVIGSCDIPTGQTKCYVEEMTLPIDDNGTPDDFSDDQYTLLDALSGNQVDLSTVYVPPESGDPMFLTNREEFKCSDIDVGCEKLGLQDHVIPGQDAGSYEYLDVYIKNNPNNYPSTLCRQDLVSCNEYSAGANNFYFKDPAETGNTVCVYKDNVDQFSGWFKDGVGKCEGADNYCRSDNDCESDKCNDIGSLPCYDNFLQNGDSYGIWSNSSYAYDGFVGQCGSQYNTCTELVDTQDTSSINPDGRSYYRIYDDRLTDRVGECNGQVSLKEGCVLFDKTDQPNKSYNSADTYVLSGSAESGGGLVNPVVSSNSADNDSNLILKVDRDRECSEWLACRDKIITTDENGNKKILCTKYEACNEFRKGQGAEGCSNFVGSAVGSEFLDEEKYISRDVSWYGYDYSGYSLLNKYQISSYSYLSFPDTNLQYLGASIPIPFYSFDSCASIDLEDTNGNQCGPVGDGRCFSGQCVYKINGSPFEEYDFDGLTGDEITAEKFEKMKKSFVIASCKAYPEEDSPFPRKIADKISELISTPGSKFKENLNQPGDVEVVPGKSRIDFTVSNEFFKNVNVCQDGLDCSCEYKKYVYDGLTDYYSVTSTATKGAPIGVCLGGDKNGEPCEREIDCRVEEGGEIISAGSCSRLKEIQTYVGVRGFCLEPDLSRPINGKAGFGEKQEYACQTWLPIQTSASNIDLFNMNLGAGYEPKLDANPTLESGELYCANIDKGGYVDASLSVDGSGDPDFNLRMANEVTFNQFASTYIDWTFDSPIAHFNCQQGDKDGVKSCVPGDTTGVCLNSVHNVYNIPSIVPNELEGITTSQINELSLLDFVTRFGLPSNLSSIGSPYYYLMCGESRDGFGFYIWPEKPDDDGNASQINYGGNLDVLSNRDKYPVRSTIGQWKSFMYKLLTGYSWNRIGTNSVVLRAEYHTNKDVINHNIPGSPSDIDANTFRFAPWLGGRGVNDGPPTGWREWDDDHGSFQRRTHPIETSSDNTWYGGLYNFENSKYFINKDSVKDFYFIPLLFKGTIRGAVPKTINDLANPREVDEKEDWDSEVLRLPIKDLNNGSEIKMPDGKVVPLNGSIVPMRGVVIDKNNAPEEVEYIGGSSGGGNAWKSGIINFSITGGNADNEKSNGLILNGGAGGSNGGVNASNAMDSVQTFNDDFSKNQLLMWRYKIERTPENENTLFSYNNDVGGVEANTQTKYVIVFFANTTNIPIDYNYGSLEGYNTLAPSFIRERVQTGAQFPDSFVPETQSEDPFQTDCEVGYQDPNSFLPEDPHYNPWLALAVNFDTDGKFLGYTSKWCRGFTNRDTAGATSEYENSNIGAGIGFATIADMANQCSEYVQVHQEFDSATSVVLNKAWTNRVWKGAINSFDDPTPLYHPFFDYGEYKNSVRPIINRSFSQQPFGSLRLSGRELDDLTNRSLREYSFEDRTKDGIPYSCGFEDSDPFTESAFISGFLPLSFSRCSFGINSNYRDKVSDGANSYDGLRTMDVLYNSAGNPALPQPLLVLSELFVSHFKRAVLNQRNIRYEIVSSGISDRSSRRYGPQAIFRNGNVGDVLKKVDYLTPPSIFSVNPLGCPDEEGGLGSGVPCVTAEHDNITVNQRTGFSKDYDDDFIVSSEENEMGDDHIAIGSFTANVKFFAFADDNRMPIRKVSVHWGDDSTQAIANESNHGYYKNSKPFCSTDPAGNEVIPMCSRWFEKQIIPSSLTCQNNFDCPSNFTDSHFTTLEVPEPNPTLDRSQTCISVNELQEDSSYSLFTYDTPRFGNAPRACTTEPFQFEHTYNCSTSYASNFGKKIGELSSKTQLLLASAGYSNPDIDICVFKPRVQVIDNWGYCNGWCVDEGADPEGGNYCYTPDPRFSEGECAWPTDFSTIDPDHAPWTEYKGDIIIVPTT